MGVHERPGTPVFLAVSHQVDLTRISRISRTGIWCQGARANCARTAPDILPAGWSQSAACAHLVTRHDLVLRPLDQDRRLQSKSSILGSARRLSGYPNRMRPPGVASHWLQTGIDLKRVRAKYAPIWTCYRWWQEYSCAGVGS